MPTLLNPALRGFFEQPARNYVLYGGRGSSKSWQAAGQAILIADNYSVKFLCTRQFQNRIVDSVYTLLKIQIRRFNLDDRFKILESSIVNIVTGSEFIFYGLQRNIQEIRSLEGVDIHWAEEAHALTQEQWEIIDPTIRSENSQHWIIFNPRFSNDFVYERFILDPPARTVTRKINYDENPFLSQTMLDVIEDAKDKPWFGHVYLGQPCDGGQFFGLDTMLVNGAGVDMHLPIDYVYAVIDSAVKTGKEHDGTAVIYFARMKHTGYPVLILDYDIVQIQGALLEQWLPSVYLRLEELARQYRSRFGSAGVFIEDKSSGSILLQQAENRGWQVTAIDSKLTAVGKDERAINISGYVFRESVKLTHYAHNKTVDYKGIRRNHLITQVAGFRPGDKDAFKRADDLLDCFTYGIAIALGNPGGY